MAWTSISVTPFCDPIHYTMYMYGITVLASRACFARPKLSLHAPKFTTTPCQNYPAYGKGVVTHPVTHPEISLHTLSAQS